MKFLLEGKTWPGAAPGHPDDRSGGVRAPAPPIREPDDNGYVPPMQVAVVDWIAETDDYGIRITTLANVALEEGRQAVYIVEHKRHKVLAQQFAVLPQALEYIQTIQERLNEQLGKGKALS